MIYLERTTDPQVVYVPRDTAICGGTLTFEMRSTVDLDTVLNAVVLDLKATRIYYDVAVALPEDAPAGSYEYALKDGGLTVSAGCLVILEGRTPYQYDKPITYEQY